MKSNKYLYEYVIQGNYGYGWDDVDFIDKSEKGAFKKAKQSLKTYQQNENNAVHRIIERRTLKT